MFQVGEKYFIHTQGENGEYRDYEIKYTFGYHPLQQYMTELENGKIQALRLAWDVPEKKWFHLKSRLGSGFKGMAILDQPFDELEQYVCGMPFNRSQKGIQ